MLLEPRDYRLLRELWRVLPGLRKATRAFRTANPAVGSLYQRHCQRSRAAGLPINAWRDIFLQFMSLHLLCRVEEPYDKYLPYLRGLLFVLVFNTFCGASALPSIKLKRSLGDVAVRDSTFGSTIRFVQTVCDRTFTVLKSHFERIGHLYDIRFWGLKSRPNHFKLNSLTSFELYHF